MKRLLLAAIFTFTNVAEACVKDIKPIKKGEVADCQGFLISPKMEEYYNDLYETLAQRNQELVKARELEVALKLKIDELQEYNVVTEKYAQGQVEKAKEDTTWAWVKGGVIGLVVGGLIGALVKK